MLAPQAYHNRGHAMGAAIFSRQGMARNQAATERFIAAVLLLASLAGSVLFGGGGVDQWRQLAPNLIGAGAALAGQLVCTWVQWTYAAQRWGSLPWLMSFGASLGMTAAGFWPLTHARVTSYLMWAQVPETTAPYIAGVLIVLLAGFLDYLPEQILTE